MTVEISFRGKRIACGNLLSGFWCYIGLMFSRKLGSREVVILRTSSASIHTFFVFFSLDVLWLDHDGNVIHKAEKITPFTPNIFCPRGGTSFIVEANAEHGLFQKVRLGDMILFAHG